MKTINATILTKEEMLKADGSDYNRYEWTQDVLRYSKYDDATFYEVKADDCYPYNRYYVSYTLPEGLKLFNSFGSSVLSSRGFVEVMIFSDFVFDYDKMKNSKGEVDFSNPVVKTLEKNEVAIWLPPMVGQDGKSYSFNNTKEAREYMTERSKKVNQIYTKTSIY